MLRSDDGLNYVCQVVNIREGFNTEENIVEGRLLVSCLFRILDDWR